MRQFTYSSLALAGILAIATTANAAPEVHGRLVLGIVANDTDTTETNLGTGTATKSGESRTKMEGLSRIRVSGEEKINDKLDLEYWLDYNIYLDEFDSKDNKNFTSRNTYLGLKHKDFGTVQVGRLYTPDDAIDYVDESWYFSSDTPWSYSGARTNNTIVYITPGFGKDKKTTATLHYAMDEGEKSSDLAAGNILYEGDIVQLGASYVYKKNFGATRLMAAYNLGDKWKLAAMGQHTDYNTKNDEVAVLASAVYHYSPELDFYGQAGFADKFEGYKDGKKTVASIGAIKTLKKGGGTKVRVFGALNYADTTSFAKQKEADATKGYAAGDLIKTQTDGFALEAGVRYDF